MTTPRSRDSPEAAQDLSSDVFFIQTTLKEALGAFQSTKTEKMSASTRKRRQERSLCNLEEAHERALELVKSVEEMQRALRASGARLRDSEDGRTEAVDRVGEVMQELETSVRKIREAQGEKLAAEKELNAVQNKATTLEAENRALQQTLQSKELEKEKNSQDAACSLGMVQQLEERNEELRGKLEVAQEEIHSIKNAHHAFENRATDREEQMKRQNDVISKLTADNVMQMIRIKEQEKSLQLHKASIDEMREEIERKRGPWFDEIRSTVEMQLKGSFEKCSQLQKEIEGMKERHEEAIAAAKDRENTKAKRIRDLDARIEQLTLDHAQSESKAAKLLEECTALQGSLEMSEKSCQITQAELKVSMDAVASIREENSNLWLQNKDLETRLSQQEMHCQEICHQKSALEAELQEWITRNGHQQRVNAELMKRKEHIEWELLRLQTASQSKNCLSSAEGTRTPVHHSQSLPRDSFETREGSHPTDA